MYVPSDQNKQYFTLGTDILHGRGTGADLSPQNIVENLSYILLCLRGSVNKPSLTSAAQLALTSQSHAQ